MTDEEVEIANKALSIVKRLERGSMLAPQDVGRMVDDVVVLAREAKAQAFEEAMKATCIHCASGVPFEREGVWAHAHGSERWSECSASAIRDLRDSLLETVPS